MFPFSSHPALSFHFNLTHSTENGPTPISDIESECKSANGDLCESFEGLFKKEDYEESTRSSEWSTNEKGIAAARKLNNCGQNQVEQKLANGKESVKARILKNFSKNSWQGLSSKSDFSQNEEEEDKIELESISDMKSCLQQKRNKLLKYRQRFLSEPRYSKLPEELLKMLQTAQKIDGYLVDKKSALYTDNLYNILKSIFSDEQMSTIWSTVKKIMFIAPENYQIRIDPLKNLCIGFGKKNENKVQVRKQKMRKLFGEYYFNNGQVYHEEGVPEAFVEPVKTARFYPENLSLCLEIQGRKVSKRYLSKLEESAKTKQAKIEEIQEKCQSFAPATPEHDSDQPLPHPVELQQFCNTVCKIYSQRRVSHMYKSTLIEHIRKCADFSLQKIFFFIKYITQEELFLQVVVKSGCKIFGLVEQQKIGLIQVLKARRGE